LHLKRNARFTFFLDDDLYFLENASVDFRLVDRPLPTKDGGTLRTIRGACDYMASMGKQREARQHCNGPPSSFLQKRT
jgi:hypothetical protein